MVAENLEIVVSMTTIPPRQKHLGPTIESILHQSIKPAEVVIYVPKVYHRFPGQLIDVESIDERVRVVEVDEDFGPLTKLLFAVRDYCGKPNVRILICDDDTIYPRDWISKYLHSPKIHENCCIVQSGGFVADYHSGSRAFCCTPRARKKGMGYRAKRILTLGIWKPETPFTKSGYVDIGEGWAGMLMKPDWFDDDLCLIGTSIRLVDDVWISAYLTYKGINIWLEGNGIGPMSTSVSRIEGLNAINIPGQRRAELNQKAIQFCSEIFKIWL